MANAGDSPLLRTTRSAGRGWRPGLIVPLLLALLAGAGRAQAHGGQVVLDANFGAYGVAVLEFATATPRELLFTVYLTEPDSGPPVQNATVGLSVRSLSAGYSAAYPVPPEVGREGYYDAYVQFPASGPWEITLQLDSPRGGASARFSTNVADPPAGELLLLVWLVALLPVAIVAGLLVYLWLRFRRDERSKQQAPG